MVGITRSKVIWCTYFSTTLNNRGCFQNSWTNHVESCWNLHAMKKRRKITKVTTIFGGFQHHHLCSMTPNIHPPFKGWPVADAQVVHIHDAKSRRFWSQIFGSWNPQSVERHDAKSVEIIWLNNNLLFMKRLCNNIFVHKTLYNKKCL